MKGAGKFEGSSSKIVFEDSEEDEDLSCSSVSSSDEEEETEKELTFEEIHKLRADGSKAVPWKPNQVKKTGRARANKNRPMEVSSKKPVSRYREVVHVPKKEVRDPRFNQLGGTLDVEGYKHLCLVNLKLLIMHSLFLFQ
jgi:ribosomal RNA-processing protein 36